MASVAARLILVALACFFVLLQPNSADGATDKVALVIGNADYSQVGTLNNTVNDASAISQSLAKIGFEAQLVTNADGRALRNAIKAFTQRSVGKSVAVVFYAGHGVQVGGENYLLPVDFDVPKSESDIRISGIKVDDLLAAIQSRVKVVFLDACRDNPVLARSLLNVTRGLAPQGLAPIRDANVGGDSGIFIAFATAAGSVAQDGDGMHSPFTQALLDNIAKPISIDDMFSLVTKEVGAETRDAQRPYKYASLDSIVCLPDSCSSTTSASAAGKPDPSAIPTPQHSGWIWVGQDLNGVRYEFDPPSRKVIGARVLMRVRSTPADRTQVMVSGVVFDCSHRSASVYEGATFRDGAQIPGQNYVAPADVVPLQPIAQGSIFDGLSVFACGEANATPKVPQQTVFSDDWIAVAFDAAGSKYYVLPASIHRSNTTVDATTKREVPQSARQLVSQQPASIENTFAQELPIIVETVSITCSAGAYIFHSTEAWTSDGTMAAKFVGHADRPLTKLAPGQVAIPVFDYICTKAGEKLVLP